MPQQINRRDFLKLASIAGGALMATETKLDQVLHEQTRLPNVIIFVFDAMSAKNLSLYGYPRQTTPNLERFAQRAYVYNAHYAGGSFTTPGTASLLTGTYPWTHRALNLFGLIDRTRVSDNLFNVLGDDYQRLAFSQNLLPNYFFEQFSNDLDVILNPASFSVLEYLYSFEFKNDRRNSYRAQEFLFREYPEIMSHSLLIGSSINYLLERMSSAVDHNDYPVGMPQVTNTEFYFTLQGLMSGIGANISEARSPFIHYYHLMPPHAPYRPVSRFYGIYDQDGFALVDKPRSNFDAGYKQIRLDEDRNLYDAFIANLDAEFGLLLDNLERNNVFENSYVIVTSDHGEMFERGVEGHLSRVLYEPGIQIPLLISVPGQAERRDIFSPTNSVDLLPTLAFNIHGTLPDWCEGEVLPGLGGSGKSDRSIFTVEAKSNSAFRPIKKATLAMRKGNLKMIYYTGYQFEDVFELYDVESDSEELYDLYPSNPIFARSMKEELLENLHAKNRQFETGE